MPINKSLFLSFATAFTLIGFGSSYQPAWAQYRQPNDAGYQSNEKDTLYGDGVTGLDPIQLIHDANLRNSRTPEQFQEESQGQLDESVTNFKELQQQKILDQQRSLEDRSPTN